MWNYFVNGIIKLKRITVWEAYDLPLTLFLNWCVEWLEYDKQTRKEDMEKTKFLAKAMGAKFK